MRILFVVTGVGYGDATREHSNIKAFLKKNPKTKVLVAGYDNSYDYFKNKYPTIKIKGYKIHGKSMRFSTWSFIVKNYFLPFYWLYNAIRLRREVKQFNPDIIISDFEPTGIALAKFVDKKCVAVFGFDPLLYRRYRAGNDVNKLMKLQARYLEEVYDKADFVIIPTLTGRKRKSLLYYYVDPVAREKPESMPSKEKLLKTLGLEKEPVLVMLGGSNFGLKLAKDVVQAAKKFPKEEFIIFGSKYILKPSKNVRHLPFTNNMLQYLKASKAVITLGGQKTLSECVMFKKPMLIFPIENHVEQVLNAYALKDLAIVSLKSGKEVVERKIKQLLAKKEAITKKMDKIEINGDGSEQIVDIVYKLAKR